MPGFFDLFFRPAEPEPEAPKPKKVKKEKIVKKTEINTTLDDVRSDIANLKESLIVDRISTRGDRSEITEPEPEPEVEDEEPEPDDDAE